MSEMVWKYRQSSNISAPQYAINPWLPYGVNLIIGPSGAGKNVLALQIAKAITNGDDFLNHKVPSPGRVMLVCLERSKEWNQHMAQQVIGTDPKYPPYFWFHDTDGKVVFNESGWKKLRYRLETATNDGEHRLRALFLDSLSELLPDTEPTDRKTFQAFFAALREWQRRFVDTIVVLHHTNQFGYDKLFLDQRDARDHKVILQSSDARWSLGQEGEYRGLIIGGHVSREAQMIFRMNPDYQLSSVTAVSTQHRELLHWLTRWSLNFAAWDEIRADLSNYHATNGNAIPAKYFMTITDLQGRSLRTFAAIVGYRKFRKHISEKENPTIYRLRKKNLIKQGVAR